MKTLSIFFSTPISNTSEFDIATIRHLYDKICTIAKEIEKKSNVKINILCAFNEDGWNEIHLPDLIKRDYDWCRNCDGAIVFPEFSYGVHMELGMLIAFNKPLLLIYGDKQPNSFFAKNISVLNNYDTCTKYSLIKSLTIFFNKLIINVFENELFAKFWIDEVKNNIQIRKKLLDPLLKKRMGDLSDKTVLDVGCGEGYSSRLITNKLTKVIGIDINKKLISKASMKSPNFSFFVSNMNNLPFENSSINFILSCNSLMNADDETVASAIKEFYRVLKPKGKCLISILHPLYFASHNEKFDILNYKDSKTITTNTINGFNNFKEYVRPLSWYFEKFSHNRFSIISFDEIFLTNFSGISKKHKKRIGYPIFSVFEIMRN